MSKGGVVGSNGKILLMRDEAVTRAYRAASDEDFGYKLGAGGRSPKADKPYNSKNQVDCSGFVAWVLGYDRLQPAGVWHYTDSIEEDAIVGTHMWRLVRTWEPVLPGDVLVYSGTYVSGERKPGHCGVIVKVHPQFIRGAKDWHIHLVVAHATPSHRRKYGNVVALTDARAWRKRGYIVRYLGFVPDSSAVDLVSVVPPKPLPSFPAIKNILPGDDWEPDELESKLGALDMLALRRAFQKFPRQRTWAPVTVGDKVYA